VGRGRVKVVMRSSVAVSSSSWRSSLPFPSTRHQSTVYHHLTTPHSVHLPPKSVDDPKAALSASELGEGGVETATHQQATLSQSLSFVSRCYAFSGAVLAAVERKRGEHGGGGGA
jgi:hypothetical protein